MKLKVTIHANKRYYLDEQFLCNGKSIMDTITQFNDIKMRLYNCLYDQRFLDKDPFDGKSYDYFLKEYYHTNSYYNCCIYSSASDILSSQKELNHLYQET